MTIVPINLILDTRALLNPASPDRQVLQDWMIEHPADPVPEPASRNARNWVIWHSAQILKRCCPDGFRMLQHWSSTGGFENDSGIVLRMVDRKMYPLYEQQLAKMLHTYPSSSKLRELIWEMIITNMGPVFSLMFELDDFLPPCPPIQ